MFPVVTNCPAVGTVVSGVVPQGLTSMRGITGPGIIPVPGRDVDYVERTGLQYIFIREVNFDGIPAGP